MSRRRDTAVTTVGVLGQISVGLRGRGAATIHMVMSKHPSAAATGYSIAEARVLAVLAAGAKPMSAYEILDAAGIAALRTPVQVYRVLKKLISRGVIHRIESLSAFVACDHGPHESQAVFAICESCGSVAEINPEAAGFVGIAVGDGFEVHRVVAEVLGRCGPCARLAGQDA